MSKGSIKKESKKFTDVKNNSKLADRLRIAVDHFGGPAAFSLLTNISKNTLFPYLSSKSEPKASAMRAFSDVGISIDWLLTGQGEMLVAKNKTITADTDYTLLPRYDVTASAGGGSLIDGEHIKDKLSFNTKWLDRLGLNLSNAALLNANGDSMEPTIKDGSVLLIKLNETEIKDGSIYVIQISGQTFVKRLKRDLRGIKIISDNPNYEQQFLTYAELEDNPMTIAGRVIWYGVYA